MERVYRFFKYNVVFALFPLGISFGLRTLANAPAPISTYAPEILFLGVMVGITAIDDINLERKTYKPLLLDLIQTILYISVFISMGLYFVHVYDTIVRPDDLSIRSTVATVAAVLSPLLCLSSIAVECFLAMVQKESS